MRAAAFSTHKMFLGEPARTRVGISSLHLHSDSRTKVRDLPPWDWQTLSD